LESGAFSARIEVRQAPGGCLTFDYEATSEREGLQHREHTVVTPEALYVAFSEGPGVSVFGWTANGIHACSAPGPHVMRIHAEFDDGTLACAWHWAESGQEPREMSRAVCHLAEF
jgi:hypothetical protein